MDGDEDCRVALIDNLDHLLHLVAIGDTNQTAKLSHSMVGMYHIIADLELLQFLQCECHLAAAGTFATQIVLVEAVENLMVGKATYV